jgi:hypothetical protein
MKTLTTKGHTCLSLYSMRNIELTYNPKMRCYSQSRERQEDIYIYLCTFLSIYLLTFEKVGKKTGKKLREIDALKIVNDFIDSVPFRWFSFSFSDDCLSCLFLCGYFQEVSGITPQYDRLIIMVSFLCLTFHL